MPLIKIPFKPGINREIPEYANEGGYDFSNLIRFRMGYAEKIGGWQNTTPNNTFLGVTRSIQNWITLLGQNLLGFGTTQQFLVQEGIGNEYHDISPAGYTASLNGTSFSTVEVGSPVLEVKNSTTGPSIMSPPASGVLDVGSLVYFYAEGLLGNLLLESSDYVAQETWPGLPASSTGYRVNIGNTANITINGVSIDAQYPQNSLSSTPYSVISVERKYVTDCVVSATSTTITITGVCTTGFYPIAGSWVLINNLNVPEYNGNYQLITSSYSSASTTVTMTYANPTGLVSAAANGTLTWINSFRIIGNGLATSVGPGSSTITMTARYIGNFGDSTTQYLSTGVYPRNKRLWSQASFGDDLIMSIQGNPIYYWAKDTTDWLPAVKLSDYANTQQYQQANVTSNLINTYSFSVDFNDYVYPGETITLGGGYGTIPTDTKIVDVTGLVVTVDKQVTVYDGTNGVVSGTILAGSGTNGTYGTVSSPIPLTGGSGSGASAIITVSSGLVSQVTLVSPGINYTQGNSLSCSVAGVTGLAYTVDSVATVPTTLNVSYSGQFVPTQTNRIFISNVYQFVIALGANPYDPFNPDTDYNPLLVRWSDQANPYQWIPMASNQSGEQSLGNGSRLITAVPNLQVILVFTDTAIYQMQYVGPPYVFSFTLLQENISIASQNAAITANNVTWWMGSDKFYMFNGSVQVLPCPIRRYVFSNLNKDEAWKIVAGYNEGFSEIWWFYPSASSSINDSYVKFNFADNVWDYGSLNRTAWNGNTTYDYPMAAHSVQNTYLTAAVTTSSSSISVADTSSFHTSGVLLIDSEQIIYTGKTATSFTGLTRPSPATHTKYTTVKLLTPNQLMFHEYGIDDNSIPNVTLPVQSFIQSSDIGMAEGNDLVSVGRIIPDLTFTNSTPGTTPIITTTVYPRLNPGSDYQMYVDAPTITAVNVPENEATAFPPEQYTGQPASRSLLVAGQGQIYTRVRGRTIAFRVDTGDLSSYVPVSGYPIQVPSNAIGNMWQLGLMRFDVRKDGKR